MGAVEAKSRTTAVLGPPHGDRRWVRWAFGIPRALTVLGFHQRAIGFQTQSVHGNVDFSHLNGRRLIRVVHVTTAPTDHFPLDGTQSRKLRVLRDPSIGARETLVAESQRPQVILAQKLVRVAWIIYWDVPTDKFEEPRDPVYLLPVLKFRLTVPHYEHRLDGLILKNFTDRVDWQCKRIGAFKVTRDSSAVRVMGDPRSMADGPMYENAVAVDAHGER